MTSQNYLQVALYKNEILKSIYKVETGKDCNCNCPICGSSLEAKNAGKEWGKPLKKGQKVAHFAHLNNKNNCKYSPETVIHKLAKEVLNRYKTLMLPPVLQGNSCLHKERLVKFDTVAVEKGFRKDEIYFIPDIILTKNNKTLFIEFYKSHLVDFSKKEKFNTIKKSCLEINLNKIEQLNENGDINYDEVKRLLEEEINFKEWIYNSNLEISNFENTIENDEQINIIDLEDEDTAISVANKFESETKIDEVKDDYFEENDDIKEDEFILEIPNFVKYKSFRNIFPKSYLKHWGYQIIFHYFGEIECPWTIDNSSISVHNCYYCPFSKSLNDRWVACGFVNQLIPEKY